MAIHLLRDYLTQNITTGNRSFIFSYVLILFLRRVLGYSYVGDTNYPINSVGSLLIATGDTTPTLTPTFPPGNKAGINLGSQKEFYVSIPASVRVVSGADIGRLLVLRSTTYPTFNSGVFVILGFETSTNSYVIDYRTLGDKPPLEAADSIMWWLYDKDVNCPTSGAGNTLKLSSEYRGDGNSTTPRIILQSPHSLGWQVRICNESSADNAGNNSVSTANCMRSTAAPGFGGNGAGDYPAFGQHFHAPMWYDSSRADYIGGAPGFGDNGGFTGLQYRITIVGDDTGQGIVMYARRPGNATAPNSHITCFGLAENEPAPLPVNGQARLFCIGSSFSGDDGFGERELNDGALQAGTVWPTVASQGMSATPYGVPCVCTASFWAYVTGTGQYGGPHFDSFATDSPFTSTTELVPIDLVQGTGATWVTTNLFGNSTNAQVYPFNPRSMGTMPHVRAGRTDFGDFSPTTDTARSYQHLRRGLYIPWNGPNIIP